MPSTDEGSAVATHPHDARPSVSVIIPVRDDGERLRACLAALGDQTLQAGAFEVVVVDDGSTLDPASVIAAFPFARLLRQSGGGSYAARNLGAAHSRGRVLAFTDADCLPRPEWLAEGVAALNLDRTVGLVAGRVEVYAPDTRPRTAVELYELHHAFPQAAYVTHPGFAATANAFTRRSVFDRVGGFDGSLRSGGDRDFGRRVVDAGLRLSYAPRACVGHPARHHWGQLLDKMDRVARGQQQIRDREKSAPRRARTTAIHRALPPARTWFRARHSQQISGPAEWLRYGAAITAVRYMWLILPIRRMAHRATHPGDRRPRTAPPAPSSHVHAPAGSAPSRPVATADSGRTPSGPRIEVL